MPSHKKKLNGKSIEKNTISSWKPTLVIGIPKDKKGAAQPIQEILAKTNITEKNISI